MIFVTKEKLQQFAKLFLFWIMTKLINYNFPSAKLIVSSLEKQQMNIVWKCGHGHFLIIIFHGILWLIVEIQSSLCFLIIAIIFFFFFFQYQRFYEFYVIHRCDWPEIISLEKLMNRFINRICKVQYTINCYFNHW